MKIDVNRRSTLAGAAVLGAVAMFVLDPHGGKRRRARIRDESRRIGREARAFARRAWGLSNRTPTDEALACRVRSNLGRVVSHPKSIEVRVRRGLVTLSGLVLADEESALIACVYGTPGVEYIENCLEAQRQIGDVAPSPRTYGTGGAAFRQPGGELVRANRTPAVRLGAGLAGCGLLVFAVVTRRAPAVLVAAGGILVVQAVRNGGWLALARGLLGPVPTARAHLRVERLARQRKDAAAGSLSTSDPGGFPDPALP